MAGVAVVEFYCSLKTGHAVKRGVHKHLRRNPWRLQLLEASVRIAQRDDVPALVALMTEFYDEAGFPLAPEPAARAFEALLDDPRLGRMWLVENAGAPVGYLVLTLGFSMEFGGLRGFIDDFFVRPTARGKGLGAAALAAVKSECAALGVRALLVETGPAEHPARRLYARAGFQESGRVLLSQALASALHESPEPT